VLLNRDDHETSRLANVRRPARMGAPARACDTEVEYGGFSFFVA